MLNKHIAQKIIDTISNVIPYDINIMDKEGIIIGSSNKERVGTIHYGAAEAISKKIEVKIYKEDEFVKPGLNIPILMNLNYYEIENIKNKFYKQNGGEELLETLLKYIEFNGEKNRISEELHIHRNTLNYRLNKIEEITNLNLNDYMDLYQLILFFLCIRIKG